MNIVFITGNHPRHKFIARQLATTGLLNCVVSEVRENHVPEPPETLDSETQHLFRMHFEKRELAEAKFFGEEKWPNCEIIDIQLKDLNGRSMQETLREKKVDLLLSYGCHMLNDATLECVDGKKWNIHGGLSPWYRGTITHFWPSYLLEPQMTGMTVHELTQELDAGMVVHQNVAELVQGDGVHDLACRAVYKMGEELPVLIQKLSDGKEIVTKAHTTTGKLWRVKDWRPEHLHLVYNFYQDRIVDQYLAGKFEVRDPKLHRQF